MSDLLSHPVLDGRQLEGRWTRPPTQPAWRRQCLSSIAHSAHLCLESTRRLAICRLEAALLLPDTGQYRRPTKEERHRALCTWEWLQLPSLPPHRSPFLSSFLQRYYVHPVSLQRLGSSSSRYFKSSKEPHATLGPPSAYRAAAPGRTP
jgi:hypothetical protein